MNDNDSNIWLVRPTDKKNVYRVFIHNNNPNVKGELLSCHDLEKDR